MTQPGHPRDIDVTIPPCGLEGRLCLPQSWPPGVVLFAHGSGSSRLSPRNTYVASVLQQAGLATLLFDLLSLTEGEQRHNVFDIDLLADRLVSATAWIRTRTEIAHLPVGYFGASTGAAAALLAAARLGDQVKAVVSRGGRPDLAGKQLSEVKAPTLLIVGSFDTEVLALNERASRSLRCESKIEIVAGATHLFEEAGTLETVADLASRWFLDHMTTTAHGDNGIG